MAGVEPTRVTLELTETAAMRDAVQMMDVLTRLRVKGFQLAIDDFGTGYSSLVQLHRLPFSEIKIDRTFVTGCTTSSESRSIVRLVIELAHALGMKAVAEGVETADALRMLRDMGCDEAQGSFIALAARRRRRAGRGARAHRQRVVPHERPVGADAAVAGLSCRSAAPAATPWRRRNCCRRRPCSRSSAGRSRCAPRPRAPAPRRR